MNDPDETNFELQKFNDFGNFCSDAWQRTKLFWIVALIACVIALVICYP